MMDEKCKTKISKFLSLVLRHKPGEIGIALEDGGWIEVEKLVAACAVHGTALTLDELREVVATSDKKRFSFDESGEKIRANQGHSVAVEIGFEEKVPPGILFHGTAEKNLGVIFAEGLKKMARHHVHLSPDAETARNVGARYGKPVILRVDTEKMRAAGFKFYVSANGVWLADSVPAEFLEVYE